MSNNRVGSVLSRIVVRSINNVTYLSPRLVCIRTCSSTPIAVMLSSRLGCLINVRFLSARTAAFAVCHPPPRSSATRASVRCWCAMPYSVSRQPTLRQIGPRLIRTASVLTPYMPTAGAPVAALGHLQHGCCHLTVRAPASGHTVTRHAFTAAPATLLIGTSGTASQHRLHPQLRRARLCAAGARLRCSCHRLELRSCCDHCIPRTVVKSFGVV